MVNLNETSEQFNAEHDRRGRRNHHNWGSRYGKSRDTMSLRLEPTGLLELEELAKRSVQLMEKHSSKSEHNFTRAMDLLRLQYNMNFIVVCEKCRGPHDNDEILAPER